MTVNQKRLVALSSKQLLTRYGYSFALGAFATLGMMKPETVFPQDSGPIVQHIQISDFRMTEPKAKESKPPAPKVKPLEILELTPIENLTISIQDVSLRAFLTGLRCCDRLVMDMDARLVT